MFSFCFSRKRTYGFVYFFLTVLLGMFVDPLGDWTKQIPLVEESFLREMDQGFENNKPKNKVSTPRVVGGRNENEKQIQKKFAKTKKHQKNKERTPPFLVPVLKLPIAAVLRSPRPCNEHDAQRGIFDLHPHGSAQSSAAEEPKWLGFVGEEVE